MKKTTRLWPLYLNQSFRAVAGSLLNLFSAVYIYKTLLYETSQPQISLVVVFAFFLAVHVFKLLSYLISEELSLKVGLKAQMVLGLLFLAFGSGCFFGSTRDHFWLWLTPLFWGASIGFWWFGRHGLLLKGAENNSFGETIGTTDALATLFLLVTPFLGGLMIDLAGYRALFGAALVFVLLAILVLKPLKDKKTHQDTDIKEVVNLFTANKRDFLAYLGDAAGATIYAVVVPLYLFLILQKELSLGEFFTVSMVMLALINWVVGRWVDRNGKERVMSFGAVVSFLVWVGRSLTLNIGIWLILDVLDRMTASMTGIPLSVLSYQKAIDGHSTGRALLFREVAISFGSILACLLMILLTWLNFSFQSIFLAAGFLSLTPLLIARN